MKTPVPASNPRSILKDPSLRLTPLASALAVGLFIVAPAANAATIAVQPGGCTLIDAITAANSDTATGLCLTGSGADTITLPAGSTQTLTAVNNSDLFGDTGLPLITSAITLAGNGSTIVRDAGAPNFRILGVASGGNLSLQDTTLSGGAAIQFGGGIINQGIVALTDSTVSGNSAVGLGGGILNFGGSLTLTRSTVSGNVADTGGGIFDQSGTSTLSNSTVSGNVASNRVGGIYVGASTLTLTDSTVSGNSAPVLGGIFLFGGTLNLSRSLISGNSASALDFEIFSSGTVTANNFNLFGFGGDARVLGFAPGASDIVPAGALATIIDPLTANGGPTQTHALVAGGPAIDAAGVVCSATDQRGVNRPKGAACDIGAFEVGTNSADLIIVKVESDNSVLVGDGVTFTLSIANFGPENATDVQVFDTLPAELSFVSANASQGSCALDMGIVTCELGDLASGAFALISLVTTANAPGAVNNTASIISDAFIDSDLNAANNSSTASVQIDAVDTTPNQFTFADQSGVPLNSLRTSDTVTITGINTPAAISVVGGEYSIGCTAIFTSAASTISSGQTVCVRHTASGNFNTAVNTILTVGGVSDTFTSTTRVADTTPNQYTFIDQTNVPRNSVRTSNAVPISGIEVPAAISVVGGGYSIGCTGVFTTTASTISSGQTVCVRHTSASTFNTGINTILTVGGVSDTFTSVTAPNALAALLGVVFKVIGGLVGGLLGALGL